MYDSKVNLIQCSVSVCDALNCKIERTWIDVELNIETCEEILLLPGFLGLCTLLLPVSYTHLTLPTILRV